MMIHEDTNPTMIYREAFFIDRKNEDLCKWMPSGGGFVAVAAAAQGGTQRNQVITRSG